MTVAREIAADGVRLNFRMSPFCRTAWVSEAARQLWKPRLERVRTALEDIAVLAVRDQAAARMVPIRPASLNRVKQLAAAHAVAVAVLESPSVWPPDATARGWTGRQLLRLGAPSAQDALPWCTAAGATGLPPRPSWDEDDPVWATAARTPGAVRSEAGMDIGVRPRWGANPLLAGIGIMAAASWPCCCTCDTAQAEAATVAALGRAHGRSEEMDWLEHMLSWPMSWSALHGIAEIKTPVFRYVRDTIATGKRLTVNCAGDVVPDAAARGLGFPFRPKSNWPARSNREPIA